MGRNRDTSAIVDGVLRAALGAGFIGTAFVFPGMVIAMDRPAELVLKKLDERERRRKLQETLKYMSRRGYIGHDYEHGVAVTPKGKKRVEGIGIRDATVAMPEQWDQKWRLIFFDIPETKRSARVALVGTLKSLDFQLLQRSIWIHPFPSKGVIKRVCAFYGVDHLVTYVVVDHIDNSKALREKFNPLLSKLKQKDLNNSADR